MNRCILVFSDGGERIYPSRRDAEMRIAQTEEPMRSRMRVVDVIEGTREEIVAEWLRERISVNAGYEKALRDNRVVDLTKQRQVTEFLRAELVVLTGDVCAPTLRPPRSELETLDESGPR